MSVIDKIRAKAAADVKHVVLAEGSEPRTVQAAAEIVKLGLAKITLVGAKAEIYEIMNELTKQGVSIIMISSELPEIINMSDRVYIMHDGKVTGCISYDEDLSQEAIMKLATQESAGGKTV